MQARVKAILLVFTLFISICGTTVAQQVTAGAVSPAYQLTNSYTQAPIGLSAGPSSVPGCTENCFTYQWQQSSTGTGGWSNISGATAPTYNPGLYQPATTSYYRLQVSSPGATTGYSNVATIASQTSVISGPVNCWKGQTATYYYTGGNPWNYTWSLPLGAGEVLSGYQGVGSFVVKWSNTGTNTITLNSNGTNYYVQVYVQNLPLDPGRINKPVQYLENGSSLALETWPGAAIGGACMGNFTYQWEYSSNGTSFYNVSNGAGISANVAPAQDMYYRRRVNCGSETKYSDTTNVVIYTYFNPGSITKAGTDSIAWNTSPGTITGSIPTGGIDTNYAYQWQYSYDNVNFANIENNGQGKDYQPDKLTQSTWFRRMVTNGNTTRNTNSLQVKVKTVLFDPGVISPYTLVINTGASPVLTGTAANGGTVATYSYQWQQSYDEVKWVNCTNGTTQNYATGTLNKTTYYRRLASNGPQSDYSVAMGSFNAIKVKVVPGLGAVNTPTTATQATSDPGISAIPVNGYIFPSINSSKVNYVRTWDIEKPGITSVTTAKSLTAADDFRQVTSYLDDFGREIQTVARKETPGEKDLTSVVNYDLLGRQVQQFLPYVDTTTTGNLKTNSAFMQQAFYAGLNGGTAEDFFYSNTFYEASPDSRPLKTTQPGRSWTGSNRGVRMDYTFNTELDSVKVWTIGTATTSTPNVIGSYEPGTLAVIVTTDEHENKAMEYKDRSGKLILKKVQLNDTLYNGYKGWLCTYYVYDVFDRLRYVLQPRAVEHAAANNWGLNPTIRAEWCFKYFYDAEGRLVNKKVPGSGDIYMVYDARDRLVMTQDSAQRLDGKWLYTDYDAQNRPVRTGLWTASGDRDYHQGLAAASTSYPSPASGTYSVLTETFYDTYDWVGTSGSGLSSTLITANGITGSNYFYSASNTTAPYPQAITATTMTTGMLTGTKLANLGGGSFLFSANFYDDRGRLLQLHSKNHTGGRDTITNQYGFNGQLLRSLVCHQKAGSNGQQYRALTKMEYDAAGRLLNVYKKAGNSTEVRTVENIYDELGRLKQKNLGRERNSSSQDSYTTTPLDSIVYDYNVRGWIRGINKAYARNEAGGTGWFGTELSYDFGFSGTQVNGNIAGIKWRSRGDGEQRAYGFGYDNVNRLLEADFTQYTGSAWNTSAGIDFSLRSMSYDANGNIIKMTQFGLKLNSSSIIDSLVYGYLNQTNKLNYVTDKANDTNSTLGDFKETTNNTSQDYLYDGNGNLTRDNNKAIADIHYNYLNLPDSITITGKGAIEYSYDAAGTKLRKTVTDNTVSPARVTRTDYLGLFTYSNDTLQFVAHEEGRIRPKRPGATDTMYYDYFERDHLGNVRVVLTDELQRDMYPVASLETTPLPTERLYYDRVDSGRVARSGIPGYPNDTYTATNNWVQKLKGNAVKIGTSTLLKVMSGDKVSVRVSSWYRKNGAAPGTPASPLTDVVLALTQGVPGASAGKVGATQLNSTILNPQVTGFLNSRDSGNITSKPKAWLNVVLLDEQLKPVITQDGRNSYFEQVGADTVLTPLGTTDREITKNGYLYIYVSNETQNIDVFFDNLQVTHTRGKLIEESHYYPAGVQMKAICTRSAGKMENKYLYNGKELQSREFLDGSGLELYDYSARIYDAQLMRFHAVDPHAESYLSHNPYHYVFNNPTNSTDPTGMDTHLEGQAARDLFRVLQNNATRLEASGRSVDVNEVDNLAQAAKDIYGGAGNFDIKAILPVWEAITPEIYYHDKEAILSHGQVLSKGPKGTSDKNRPIATNWYKKAFPAPPFSSADEYPFAFTNEGGEEASVRYVPVWEQNIQRFQLSLLSMALNVNDRFIVVPISKDDAPSIINTPFFWLLPNGQWKKNHNSIDRRDHDPVYKQLRKNLEKPAPANEQPKPMPAAVRNALIGIGIAALIILTEGVGVLAL